MIRITSISALRSVIQEKKRSGVRIGLVPTMGALHKGHLSLVEQSVAENDLCIVSIFVNPLQFNNPEDFTKYPVQHDQDIKLIETTGCQYVFMPDAAEFYPVKPQLSINMGRLDTILEGEHRPGHFSGVAVIVTKLFNVVQPDTAYFGQKDLQQLMVIRQLVEELNMPVEIIACPIVREDSGLAMSSRNMRLSAQGKEIASHIYKAIQLVEGGVLSGERNPSRLRQTAISYLNDFPEITVEYIELVDGESLAPVNDLIGLAKVAVCLAVWLEGVRLIDNSVIIL